MPDTAGCPECGAMAPCAEVHVRTGRPDMVGGRPRGDRRAMRILLLCSAFNGLTQRAWVELRAAGHDVVVQESGSDAAVREAVAAADPDLVLCPFLRERIPSEVWRTVRTVVIHPGPPGDRGPSSLDWAIMEAAPAWGVTALQAVEEFDAGPIWGSRAFSVGATAPCKSALYNGPVTDAAMALMHEVVAKAADPAFAPEPLDYSRPLVRRRLRAAARQSDRRFRWSDPTAHVLRRIRAADGAPGVHAMLCGVPVAVFDAHRGSLRPAERGEPGTVAVRRHGAVLVRTGGGGVWVGQLRSRAETPVVGLKLPAAVVLRGHLADVPEASDDAGHQEIDYHRDGSVGVLTFRFYNGAMSTDQCRRLHAALRHAVAQDTRVLLLRGGQPFSNGLHLGVIEAAEDPAAEAWANIVAIDDVCQEIITCTGQLVVCSVAGNAGAGGVMLALGADRVVLREGVVLNPHYATMGLRGSEYWTYVLPRRVGERVARTLTANCRPVGAAEAVRIGLADVVLPGDHAEFERAAQRCAARLAAAADHPLQLADKQFRRAADERRKPLRAYRRAELVDMSDDILNDRHGFARARSSFLGTASVGATATPATA